MKSLIPAACLLALAAPNLSHADTAADLNALREEIKSMRNQYEERIRALEGRCRPPNPRRPRSRRHAPAPAPTTAAAPSPVAPGDITARSPGTGFNPALSLILSGLYTRTSRDPSTYRISGFALAPGCGDRARARAASASANPNSPYGEHRSLVPRPLTLAFAADNSAAVEEAFVQTTALGQGFTLKAGRFLSSIGYLNPQHAHTWDFVDAPLAYQAMLGSQYGDDGVQLAWLAPTDQYLELRAELGRGRSFPGGDCGRQRRRHGGADRRTPAATSAPATAGAPGCRCCRPRRRTSASGGRTRRQLGRSNAFSGNTRIWIADGVWKWAPNGNAKRTNFKLQGEYLHARATAAVVDADGAGEPARLPRACSRAGTCKASTSSCRAGASDCAPTGWTRARRYGANSALLRRPATGARAATALMLDYEPERVQPPATAVRQRPRALRQRRQPVVPAIPDEPGRARRARLLNGSTCHEHSSTPSHPAAALLIALAVAAPAHAALRVFACEPEWGALAQELGGDQVEV